MQSNNNKHLEYAFLGTSPSGKTKIWEVHNVTTDSDIGIIRWAGNFRKYAFWPYNDTYYDSACLEDIASFLQEAMDERV